MVPDTPPSGSFARFKPGSSGPDSSYRAIMDATGRHTTRARYSAALLSARHSLVEVRSFIASNLHAPAPAVPSHTSDAPPNFSPLVSDPNMQAILQRRWAEVQRCLSSKANLAATVMMGGLLESLLLAKINGSSDKPAVFTTPAAPRDKAGKTLSLSEWKLVKMVDVAHELTWITSQRKMLATCSAIFGTTFTSQGIHGWRDNPRRGCPDVLGSHKID